MIPLDSPTAERHRHVLGSPVRCSFRAGVGEAAPTAHVRPLREHKSSVHEEGPS
jgi:hypothetical protein